LSTEPGVRELRFDVGDAVGEPAELVATYYPPSHAGEPPQPRERPVLVCLPGGTYTRGYFDLEVPGHADYSYARDAAARGFPVVAFDVLGTGASSRPGREIELTDQAAATALAVEQLPDAVGHAGPFVGVGHSMGAYVAIFQQAAHRSYAAVAILGTTNREVEPLGLPEEVVRAAATAEGRAALVEQAAAAMPDPYIEGGREPLLAWFHLADVPRAVVEADNATTLTVVPRRCGAAGGTPGIAVEAAAAIDVPVFLAYGDVDVSPSPHGEPAFYPSSPDVTLYVLRGSGHCHNMASSRRLLWERLARWFGTVVD